MLEKDKDIYTKHDLQLINKELEHKDKQLSNKDNEIAELRKQVEMLILSNSKPSHIEGDAVINNIYNISLNAFGNEKTEYITSNFIQKITSIAPMNSVPNLLKEIHFNPEHKENHNIYIPNKKQSFAKIWDGNKWILTRKKEVIEDMTNKALEIMTDNDEPVNKKLEIIKNDYINGDKKTMSRIHEDTELMILNEGENISKIN